MYLSFLQLPSDLDVDLGFLLVVPRPASSSYFILYFLSLTRFPFDVLAAFHPYLSWLFVPHRLILIVAFFGNALSSTGRVVRGYAVCGSEHIYIQAFSRFGVLDWCHQTVAMLAAEAQPR